MDPSSLSVEEASANIENEQEDLERIEENEQEASPNIEENKREDLKSTEENERENSENIEENEREDSKSIEEHEREDSENFEENERDASPNIEENERGVSPNIVENERRVSPNIVENEREDSSNIVENEREDSKSIEKNERENSENIEGNEREDSKSIEENEREDSENIEENERDASPNIEENERENSKSIEENERENSENIEGNEREDSKSIEENEREDSENIEENERDASPNIEENERGVSPNIVENEREDSPNIVENEREDSKSIEENERENSENIEGNEREDSKSIEENEREDSENIEENERDALPNIEENERGVSPNIVENEREDSKSIEENERETSENIEGNEREDSKSIEENEREDSENIEENERDALPNIEENERGVSPNIVENERDDSPNIVENEREAWKNIEVNIEENEREDSENIEENERGISLKIVKNEQKALPNIVENKQGALLNIVENEQGASPNVGENKREILLNIVENERKDSLNIEENEQEVSLNIEENKREVSPNIVENERDSVESTKLKNAVPEIVACIVAASFHLTTDTYMAYAATLITNFTNKEAEAELDVTPEQIFWIDNLDIVWIIISVLLAGFLMDTVGRVKTLQIGAILCVNSKILIALATNVPIFLVGRFLFRMATTLATSPAVVYITEVARPKLRGSMISSAPTLASFGMALSYLAPWQLVAWISISYMFVSVIAMLFLVPESPVWLVSKGRFDDAERSLEWLYKYERSQGETSVATTQLNILKEEIKSSNRQKSKLGSALNKLRRFLEPTGWKPMAILFLLFSFQQFSGVYITLFYVVSWFSVKKEPILGFLNFYVIEMHLAVSILSSTWLLRYKRRTLCTMSSFGMMMCMIGFGYYTPKITNSDPSSYWVPLVILSAYMFISTAGMLIIPWTMTAELFPTEIRGIAHSISYSMGILLMYAALQSYKSLEADLKGLYAVPWFFAGVSMSATVFVFLMLPETHGKKLSEIQKRFCNNFQALGA